MEDSYLKSQIDLIDTKIHEAETLLEDSELGELAKNEIEQLKLQKHQLQSSALEIANSISSKSTNTLDKKNAILEIKGAAGGDEAKNWARELMRMYMRFAEDNKYSVEQIDDNSVKFIQKGTFGLLKYEAG